jgi:L-alanine-DL-glutamate epimerase-like enolase superfamily enzyme
VTSTLEGPVGIAAALHVAAALGASAPLPPCGLATLRLFEGPEDALPVDRGAIAVPQNPGLGIGER